MVMTALLAMASCQTSQRQTEDHAQALRERHSSLLTEVYRDLAIIRGVKALWAGPPPVYSGPGEREPPGHRHSHDETPTEADLARHFRDRRMPSPPVGRYVIKRVDQAPEFRVTVEELDTFLNSAEGVEHQPGRVR